MKRMVLIMLLVSMCLGCASYKNSGGFQYEIINETKCRIVGYTGTDTDIVIPEKIGDRMVVEITNIKRRNDQNKETVYGAFAGKGLTSVIIPNSVTTIGEEAFRGNKLTEITIPNGVTSIGTAAFMENSLAGVTIPNSVTTIGELAFRENQLASVTIPDSVRVIGHSAFSRNKLTNIIIPNSVKVISSFVFIGNQLTEITISNGVTSIENSAFMENRLTSVTIPTSVTKIEESAFANNQLTGVTIPDNVTYIGAGAFNSNLLNTVNIPVRLWENGVIGNEAFGDSETTTIVFSNGKSIALSRFNEVLSSINNLRANIVRSEGFHQSMMYSYEAMILRASGETAKRQARAAAETAKRESEAEIAEKRAQLTRLINSVF